MTDLSQLEVRRVVIHDVPPPDSTRYGPLVLTDAPIALDDDLRNYFSRKVVDSLGARGLEVMADPDGPAEVREAVVAVRSQPASLVPRSQRIAEQLYTAQTNINSPGLLAVAEASMGADRCIAVLKLEREQGLRFSITQQLDGNTVIDVQLLRDLTLTDRTRVFKTAVLAVSDDGDANDVTGRVSDDQRGRREGNGVASFFLSNFLGCQLLADPAVTTRDFVRAAETYFNDAVANPETRAQYQIALLSKMQDNVVDIRPRTFADEVLAAHDRSGFLAEVRRRNVDPDVAFQKDPTLVRVERGFKMVFRSGMVLVGSTTDLRDRVDSRSDNTRTIIRDAQSRLQGR